MKTKKLAEGASDTLAEKAREAYESPLAKHLDALVALMTETNSKMSDVMPLAIRSRQTVHGTRVSQGGRPLGFAMKLNAKLIEMGLDNLRE